MEINYIREFIAVAKYGNYLTAAEELFISQSSLSKHILALERELGYPLLIRTTRKVQLSQYGRLFLPYAQNIVDADAAYRRKISEMNTASKDSIHLGVLPSFLAYHFDQIIMDFKRLYPQYPVSLIEEPSDALLHHLKEGTCSLVVIRTYEDTLSSEFVSIPIFQDRLALLVTPGSPLDNEKSMIGWEELEGVELLTGVLNSKSLALLMEQQGIHLNIVSRMSRASTTMDMVRRGVYNAALINKLIAEFYITEGSFKILNIEPPICSTISLVYRKDTPQTAAIRHFIETVRSYTAKQQTNTE